MFNATLVVKAEVSLVEEGETLKSETQRPAKARTLASSTGEPVEMGEM